MKFARRFLKKLWCVIILAAFLCSCSLQNHPALPSKTPEGKAGENIPTPAAPLTPDAGDADEVSQNPSDSSEQRISEIIVSMSLEEKVGQMLFLAYRKDEGGRNVIKMDDTLKEILSEYSPGGFVLFSENLETISQTVNLINDIQSESKIPLFISVDEEGGIVSRLNKASGLHSTVMPDAFTIGLTNNPEYAYRAARVIADELSSLGFNMNFAPVADIFSNPENTVIGKRAYGTEPKLVSAMVSRAVDGFIDGSIIPVLKHFPGHGDTAEDTHTGAATVGHDLERLMNFELIPFREGIESGADAIMVSHIIIPKLMDEPVPATLSKEVVTGLLREKLGFEGVVITDALEMNAVSSCYDDGEAAVKSVLAGCDMLLMPQSAEDAFNALLSAVKRGIISEERINESVRRILWLKHKYGILDGVIQRPDPEITLGCDEHRSLASEIINAAENELTDY